MEEMLQVVPRVVGEMKWPTKGAARGTLTTAAFYSVTVLFANILMRYDTAHDAFSNLTVTTTFFDAKPVFSPSSSIAHLCILAPQIPFIIYQEYKRRQLSAHDFFLIASARFGFSILLTAYLATKNVLVGGTCVVAALLNVFGALQQDNAVLQGILLLSLALQGALALPFMAKNFEGTLLVAQLVVTSFAYSFGNNEGRGDPAEGRQNDEDIKCVMLCLDGFVGPRSVVCGIRRAYEAWIRSLLKADRRLVIVLVTAFDADEMRAYFGNHFRLVCYKVDAHAAHYVRQTYYSTMPNLRNVKAVSAMLERHRPNVVHCIFDGLSTPTVAAACAWKSFTSKDYAPAVVGVVHTDAGIVFERNGFGTLYTKILMFCQRYCVGNTVSSIATRSQSFAEAAEKKYGFRFDYVIKPHVDTRIFKPAESELEKQNIREHREKLTYGNPDALLVLYAGRFDLDKRVGELLKMIKAAEKNVYLALIGDGMMRETLLQMSSKENRIFVSANFVDHETLASYYKAADVHISASQMETLGNTVLESIACGTPVLVPKAQGFKDTVKDGVTGRLWEASSLDDGIQKLLAMRDDPQVLWKLKDGALRSALSKENGVDATVDGLIDWYTASIHKIKQRSNPAHKLGKLIICGSVYLSHVFIDKFFMKQWIRIIERFSSAEERAKQMSANEKKSSNIK